MSVPRVALIMSTYNNGRAIIPALSSCLSQEGADVVVVVADDGSADDTVAVMRGLQHEHGNLHIIPLPHGERGVARIAAIDRARELGADYLVVLDSDMVLRPGLVASCLGYLAAHPGVGALVLPEDAFSDWTNYWTRVKVFERNVLNNAGADWGRNSIEAARFWRFDAYDSTGGFDPEQISFEEIQPTIRYDAAGGMVKRATFTGLRHDEKHVTLRGLVAKKKYYFSVMDRTLAGEEAGVRSALQRFYFFRPVLYRPSNLARYARHPGLAAGMVAMYGVLTGVAAAELVKGRVRARRAPDPHGDQGPVPGDERSAP